MITILGRLTGAFIVNNIALFCLTLLFSIPLGLLVSFGSMSKFKPLSILIKIIIWIIRGTPLMLQILIIFFGPGLMELGFGWPKGNTGRMIAATIAFVINYACYFSEIFRGGIQGVPRGQQEAGQVLGMTKTQIFFRVTLLQMVKRIVPPMSNEIITLIKDTALANYISIVDVIMTAKEYTTKGLIWPLFATGIYFLAFVGIITILLGWIEKKLDYFRA